MSNLKLAIFGFINALGAALYTSLVAWVLYNGERFFGANPGVLGVVTLLLLFVLSASVVGALVLGRPVILYVNGLRSSAVKLFFYTVAWLMVFTVGILIYHIWK